MREVREGILRERVAVWPIYWARNIESVPMRWGCGLPLTPSLGNLTAFEGSELRTGWMSRDLALKDKPFSSR